MLARRVEQYKRGRTGYRCRCTAGWVGVHCTRDACYGVTCPAGTTCRLALEDDGVPFVCVGMLSLLLFTILRATVDLLM